MKTDHERSNQESRPIAGHEERNGEIEEGCKPMHNQQVDELAIQKLSEWRKEPMLTETGHGVAGEPFQRELLQARIQVQDEELKLDEKVIPIGNGSPEFWIQPTVQRTVCEKKD